MSGYMFVMSGCIGCGNLMTYNAEHVPSIIVDGVREPICQECVYLANPERVEQGLEPIVPHPDAYKSQELT
jgi:hypothetical protein